jgi:hypothetical protein
MGRRTLLHGAGRRPPLHRGGASVVWRAHAVVVSTPRASARRWGPGSPRALSRVMARRPAVIVVTQAVMHVR